MRVLDLFCGAGMAADGYAQAGFEPTAVVEAATVSDIEYMGEALRYARQHSHDDRTQVGAVLVAGKRLIYAANQYPTPMRGEKYATIEHAERAAIYKAAACGIPTAGAVLYAPWFACTDCARAIILSGVREVVGLASLRRATPERWLANIKMADEMLGRAGVSLRWMAGTVGATIRFDGGEFQC